MPMKPGGNWACGGVLYLGRPGIKCRHCSPVIDYKSVTPVFQYKVTTLGLIEEQWVSCLAEERFS